MSSIRLDLRAFLRLLRHGATRSKRLFRGSRSIQHVDREIAGS